MSAVAFVVDFEPGLHGPFATREAAQEWASRHVARAEPDDMVSWTVRPVAPTSACEPDNAAREIPADKRDECGCHRECTTLPHECERPCTWPNCLTDAEHRAVVAALEREIPADEPTISEVQRVLRRAGLRLEAEVQPADELAEAERKARAAVPIDWPARFRAAADAAERAHWYGTAEQLRDLASHLTGTASRRTRVVEAIGRALTEGEDKP